METTETIMVRGISPRLKGKIARRVEAEGTNMNDVLVGILAREYRVKFQPTGARRLAVGASPQVLLTVPAELKRLIAVDAAEQSEHISNIARRIISDEFGVPFKATGRRAGTTTRRPAAAR